MKWTSFLLSGLLALIALLPDGPARIAVAQSGASENGPLVVSLKPKASIDDALVYLEQIATLEGGNAELRRRVARLDVAEFDLHAVRATVSSGQVKFRLFLSGLASSQFQLLGAKQTIVTESAEPITARKILAKAESAWRHKYPGDDVSPSIMSFKGYSLPFIKLYPADRVQLDAKVSAAARAGKVRVDVAIIVNGTTRDSVPVHLETPQADLVSKAGLGDFGILPAGNITPAPDNREVVVKRADAVRIVAKIGTVRIEAKGEAMQDGKTGDLIRVRNINSSNIVLGRVDGRGIVLVDD